MEPILPDLMPVPGGEFLMGKDSSRADEAPAHRVTVAAFRAAVSPVTNREYDVYTAATGAPPAPFRAEERFAAPGAPVVGINWPDAIAYCEWLSGLDGVEYRLPTEAEREFAALGGRDE